MRRGSVVRFLTSALIASFAFAGPVAPLGHAQQQAAPAESAPVAQPTESARLTQPVEAAQATQPAEPVQVAPPPAPPAPPAQPAQPDLFQETLQTQRSTGRYQGLYQTEAVFVNMVRVPGKAILCVAGTVVGFAILGVSFGSGYQAASSIFHEGCAGKWIVSGDDLRPDVPPTIVSDPGR